jgi:hypothetical protein
MKLGRLLCAMAAPLVLMTAAAAARAEQAAPALILAANDFAAPTYGVNGTTTPRRTLEWDASKGRWGLNLGVEQHTDRDVQLKDVSPGVYYRVTRRLHIGGAVSLAPDEAETQRLGQPQMPAPRVRLETTFKF